MLLNYKVLREDKMPHSFYAAQFIILCCAGQVSYQYNCIKTIHVEKSHHVIQDTHKKQPCLLLCKMLSAVPALHELQAL